jgi:hypothetical protein
MIVEQSRIAKLIGDLDDERFRVRYEATQELEKMGDLPGRALLKALDKPPSLEARIISERLLDRRARSDQAAADARAWELGRHLLSAYQIIERSHVTPASRQQMAVWSVQGMYQEAKEPIPVDIASRLKNLGNAKPEEIRQLLRDARFHLGLRREFDDDKDLDVCLGTVFAQLEPGARPTERSCYIRPEYVQRVQF